MKAKTLLITTMLSLNSVSAFAWYESGRIGGKINWCTVACTASNGGQVKGYAGSCDTIPKDGGCPPGSSSPKITKAGQFKSISKPATRKASN